MSRGRRETRDDRCPKCRINFRWCFCDHIETIDSDLQISIVMHFSEKYLTSNTAYFASLLLPNCEIVERGIIDKPIDENKFNQEDVDYLYLFPTEDSLPIDEFQKSDRKIHLIVPDGSWSKAKKIHKREKSLKNIKKYHLREVGHSRYKLRKSPGENYLCTYEAIAHCVGILDSKDNQKKMLNFFDVFVERVLMSRKGEFLKNNDSAQIPEGQL